VREEIFISIQFIRFHYHRKLVTFFSMERSNFTLPVRIFLCTINSTLSTFSGSSVARAAITLVYPALPAGSNSAPVLCNIFI